MPAEEQDLTPADQETIDADDVAQEAADQLSQTEAIERNSRLWVTAITPILSVESANPLDDELVRAAIDNTKIAACARLERLLKSDLPKG